MAEKDFTDREKEMAGRCYRGNDMRYLQEVLACGKLSSLSGGTFVPRFEKKFAQMLDVARAVAMNSCMSTLHAAMICAGAKPGCEVICDSEFVFAAMAVLYTGAIPIFVDIDPITHNMDATKLEAAINERTKAIVVTHAWGLPADMDEILRIARRRNLLVVEDCAESILATYKGRYTGSLGDIGCFSFQASKQLSLGDGGMATANSEAIAESLALHAGAPTWQSVAYGLDFNYRMNEPTAAIGLAQLEVLPQVVESLRANAAHYDEAVKGCPWLHLQRGPDYARHSFYHWAATFDGERYGITLDQFKAAIRESGLKSITVGYTQMPAYKQPVIKNELAHAYHCAENRCDHERYPEGLCPVAERVIPRVVIAYVLGSEHMAREEAEKLHDVVVRLESGSPVVAARNRVASA
jgi:dTDP-4-amino-4,6-dideoxygalactose transaminase